MKSNRSMSVNALSSALLLLGLFWVGLCSAAVWEEGDITALEGDYNSDGYSDIVLYNPDRVITVPYGIDLTFDGLLANYVMYGDATGTYGTPVEIGEIDLTNYVSSSFDVLMGDIDGDGYLDLFLKSNTGNQKSLIIYSDADGNPTTTIQFSTVEGFTLNDKTTFLKDINNDGRDDLVVENGPTAVVALAKTDGTFNQSNQAPTGTIIPGSLPGQFSVGSSGAASYSIPIAVPIGGAGMQPQLSFSYSSGASNGLLGTGWSVSQSSSITRCARTYVERTGSSSNVVPVTLSADDQFCLDGVPLFDAGNGRFYLKQENFSRITSYGEGPYDGPLYFKVEYKSGETAYYGNYNESPNALDQTTGTFYLTQISDRANNSRNYDYEKNTSEGEHRLARISYPGGEVTYYYEDRNDTSESWLAGKRSQSTQRLKKLETSVSGAIYRTYHLDYTYSPVRQTSRLESIQECGADGSCLAPTTFAWEELGSPAYTEFTPDIVRPSLYEGTATPKFQFVDINGDGYQDLFYYRAVRFNKGDGTFDDPIPTGISTTNFSYFLPLDMDGDGGVDFLVPDANSDDYYLLKYNGVGFDYTKILDSRPGWNKNNIIADMNGDGLPDLIYISGGKRYVRFGQGISFSAPIDMGVTDNGWEYSFAFDLEGDGKQEILYSHSSNGWTLIRAEHGPSSTWFNDDYQFSEQALSISTPTSKQWSVSLADFNGDGLSDLIYINADRFQLHINNGSGFNSAVPISGVTATDRIMKQAVYGKRYMNIDYDDDGRTDILYPFYDMNNNTGSLKLLRQTGDFSCYSLGQNCFTEVTLRDDIGALFEFPKYDVDLNNDGFSDVVVDTGSLIGKFYISFREEGGLPGYLSSVTNSFGLTTRFNYGKVESTPSNSDLYNIVNGATESSTQVISGPINVVSSVVIEKGEGYDDVINYSYEDLIYQRTGLGSLGFKKVIATTNERSRTETTYNHQWSLGQHGRIEKIESHVNDSGTWKRVSDVNYAYQTDFANEFDESSNLLNSISTGAKFTYLKETIESKWELDGSLIIRTTTAHISDTSDTSYFGYEYGTSIYPIDDELSGNTIETIVTVESGDGSETHTVKTNSFYEQEDYASWNLGRVTSAIVSNSGTGRVPTTKKSAWEYYADGRLWKEIIEPDNDYLKLTKSYTYNALGLKETVTSVGSTGVQRSISTTYDSLGRYPTSVTNDIGTTYTSYHPVFGTKTAVTSLNGLNKYWTYDGFGRVKGTYNADGTYSTAEFKFAAGSPSATYHLSATETVGQPAVYFVESTNQNNVWSKTYFDKFGKAFHKRSLDAFGQEVRVDTQYTAYGETYRVSEPYFSNETASYWTTTETLDPLKRALSVMNQERERVTFQYEGLTTKTTNEKGYSKTETKSVDGKLKSVIDENLNEVTYIYDASGNMTSMKDETSVITTDISYDGRGRKVNMNDPNKGYWEYRYNAFGDLVIQTDAMNVTICQAYDSTGRMVKRIDNYAGSEADAQNDCAADESNPQTFRWFYDTAANGLGKLHRVEGPNSYSETYRYDSLGRAIAVSKVIKGETFVSQTSYDSQSRPVVATYPSGFAVRNEYNTFGALTEVGKAANNEYYWRLEEIDHRGNPTRVSLAEGVMETQKTYTPARGFVERIMTSSALGVGDLQSNYAEYDTLANVKYRRDDVQNSQEIAEYDSLNRLIYIDRVVNGVTQARETMTYAQNGNIENKWDIAGDYAYGGACDGVTAGPHAVTAANNNTYCYDKNGSMLSGAGRNIIWGAFGKPTRIEKGATVSVDFEYGPDRKRIRRVDTKNTLVTETIYVGNYEKVLKSSGGVDERHYVGGFLIVNKTTDGASTTTKENYLLKDNLGSLIATIDLAQLVFSPGTYLASRTSFDAWGMRRNQDWSAMSLASLYDFKSDVTDRGFTGHEQIDEVGLIHMNGRLYDPVLGRFISADPIIQSPTDLQSLNRYTYVRNNPLTLIDPSGFNWWSKQWKKWGKDLFFNAITLGGYSTWKAGLREFGRFARKNKYVAEITQIVGCAVTAPTAGAGCAAISAAVTYGVTDGNFKAAVKAGAIAYTQSFVAGQIGDGITAGNINTPGAILAHGLLGGAVSVAQGSKFGYGFAAGAFGKAAMMGLQAGGASLYAPGAGGGFDKVDFNSVAARTTIAALVGGTASELSGGTFANGAVTAAMQHLFNAEGGAEGIGKWLTTDVDVQEGRTLAQLFVNRTKSLGDEGRLFGSEPKDFENTVRDVTQEWVPLTTDETNNLNSNGFVSVRRTYGETRVIRQTYYEGNDSWAPKGKSYHWQPVVGREEYEGTYNK